MVALGLLMGCEGLIQSGGSGGAFSGSLEDVRIAPRVWRLSAELHKAEVQRLFPGAPDVAVPQGASEHYLTDIAETARIDEGNVGPFVEGAKTIASWVVTQRATALRCTTYGTPECADTYLGWLLPAAYRRAPTAAEAQEARALFNALSTAYDFDFAVQGLTRAVLLSPQFSYRTELGDAVAPGPQVRVLAGHEIALLMAFGITGKAPDDALLAASAQLADADVREQQARRLMAQSAPAWRRFFWEWMHLSTLASQAQEVELDAVLVPQMREEFDAFVDQVVVQQRGTLSDLLTGKRTWIRPELARHYGLTHPGSGVQPVEVDTGRGGLLTQGAWLVSKSKRGRDNVVRRGMAIYLESMCNQVTPPNNLDLTAEVERIAGPNATVAQVVQARSNDASCGHCHRVPDPMGLAFEVFSSTAQLRQTYGDGNPVLPSIEIEGLGTVTGGADLGAALVQNERFRQCLVQRVGHFLLGVDPGSPRVNRWPNAADAAFVEHGLSFEELLVAYVKDPAYVERAP